jgi:hypothetical protein
MQVQGSFLYVPTILDFKQKKSDTEPIESIIVEKFSKTPLTFNIKLS